MTIVVGFDPDGHGKAVLHLAAMLARSADEDLLVCAVLPVTWPPSPAKVDAEYQAQLERTADAALAVAKDRLPLDIEATYVIRHARSAAAGLLEVAEAHDASVIAVGSAVHGPLGRVTLGSTTSRLMHTSSVAIALAPRGYRARPGARVRRVTAAYGGPGGDDLVVAAAAVAARIGSAIRIASFAVRKRPPYTAGVGLEADRAMVADWTREIEAAARDALGDDAVETVVGYGETWEQALEDVDWEEGEVLVVGSSPAGPVARVFLGSRAAKIVRHSPVPLIVVPRAVAVELAEEAATG